MERISQITFIPLVTICDVEPLFFLSLILRTQVKRDTSGLCAP